MYLDKAKKEEIFGQYGKRRKLLKHLYNKDINRYRAIIKALGLRK